MGSGLTALFMAAGAGAFAYSRLGRNIGYGNTQSVWLAVAGTFVIVFLIVFILLKTLVTL